MSQTLVCLSAVEDLPRLLNAASVSSDNACDVHVVSFVKESVAQHRRVDGSMTPKGEESYSSKTACMVAHDTALFEACDTAGIPVSHIHMYHHRANQNALTLAGAQEALRYYLERIPAAQVVAFSPAGGMNQPIDQRILGLAVMSVLDDVAVSRVVFADGAQSVQHEDSQNCSVIDFSDEERAAAVLARLRMALKGQDACVRMAHAVHAAEAKRRESAAKESVKKVNASKSMKIGKTLTSPLRACKRLVGKGKK